MLDHLHTYKAITDVLLRYTMT